jgi:hypothetical protein
MVAPSNKALQLTGGEGGSRDGLAIRRAGLFRARIVLRAARS